MRNPVRSVAAALLTVTLLPAIALSVAPAPAQAELQTVGLSELFPNERQARTTLVINKVLERFHYRSFRLNDDFALATVLNYFEDLDPNKSFFLQRDIDRFTRGADRLDDDLGKGKLDAAFDIFRVYRMRVDSPHRVCAVAA
jgi:carboxyl-terminal processing protease